MSKTLQAGLASCRHSRGLLSCYRHSTCRSTIYPGVAYHTEFLSSGTCRGYNSESSCATRLSPCQVRSKFGFPVAVSLSRIPSGFEYFTKSSPSFVRCICSSKLLRCSSNNSQQDARTSFINSSKISNQSPASPGGILDPAVEEKPTNEEKKDGRFTGKNIWKLGLAVMIGWSTLTGGMLISMWGSPHKTEEGEIIIDEFSDLPTLEQYLKRTYKGMLDYKSYIADPSSPKLLPDPLKEPYYQPPYTLVIELTGVLVHPEWTYKTGWRFKKRPGIDYLLQKCGPPNFEIVIFTQEQAFTAFPLIDSMDPKGYIMYRLFRDATRYMDGHHVKDLECLNRDMSKVIFVDWNQKSFKLQPENAFPLQKWDGDDADRKLFDLANLLSVVAASGVSDVREVLRHYSQFDDPLAEFRANQRRLQEQQEEKLRQVQKPEVSMGLLPRKGLSFWR